MRASECLPRRGAPTGLMEETAVQVAQRGRRRRWPQAPPEDPRGQRENERFGRIFVVGGKRRVSAHHLEEQAAERPPVDWRPVLHLFEELRRLVHGGADLHLAALGERRGEAKVGDDIAVLDQEVLGLQVAVAQPSVVQRAQAKHDHQRTRTRKPRRWHDPRRRRSCRRSPPAHRAAAPRSCPRAPASRRRQAAKARTDDSRATRASTLHASERMRGHRVCSRT